MSVNNALTATGLLGCAWWAGAVASMSLYAAPAALQTGPDPKFAIRVWKDVYSRGAATGPTLALATFTSLSAAAYARHREDKSWIHLVLAGALNLAIVPFTRLFMLPTNNTLLAAAGGLKTLSWEQTEVLVRRWKMLNLCRSALPLLGSLVGLWFVLDE